MSAQYFLWCVVGLKLMWLNLSIEVYRQGRYPPRLGLYLSHQSGTSGSTPWPWGAESRSKPQPWSTALLGTSHHTGSHTHTTLSVGHSSRSGSQCYRRRTGKYCGGKSVCYHMCSYPSTFDCSIAIGSQRPNSTMRPGADLSLNNFLRLYKWLTPR